MEKQRVGILTYLTNLGFLFYFILLFAERCISIALSCVNKVNIFDGYFHGFTYILAFASLIGFIVYLIVKCRSHFAGICNMDVKVYEKINFVDLTIASGILLFSGMVHTEYTISGLQFASYGFLIASILFKVIETSKTCDDKPMLWLSFAYLVCYAMAVPVMYPVSGNLAVAAYVASTAAVLILVVTFTLLTIKVFQGDGKNLFNLMAFVIMLALSGSVLILRWPHEGNMFVLIFVIASAVLYIAYLIYFLAKKKKQ